MHRIDGAGHVDNLFVPEDPATLRPPTEITPEIMNAFQEELATFIEWAGIALAKGDNTQFRLALSKAIQEQKITAFTTTGAAGTFVLTPTQTLTAYAAGQRFRAKFHTAGNGADVINISGLGNKSLKQYDSAGAKIAPIIAANQLVDIEYDGVDFVLLDPMPNPRGSQAFLASGNFTVPAGVTTVFLTGCGGGGGGGAYVNTTTGASGGGGAAACLKRAVAVTPGQVVAVTIGAFGNGSQVQNTAGTAGGTSSFGALLSLGGGGAGAPATAGGGGGTISGGTGVGIVGQAGEQYNPILTTTAKGGVGGGSMFGQGGQGGGQGTSNVSGGNASGYGAGGGGGATGGGGYGSPGFLIVEW